LYADRSSEYVQRLISSLLLEIKKKYEFGGQLKFKIDILFYGDNSWTVALRQTKFVAMKDDGHTYKFYLNNYFL
jgi:hypothetical protein